MGNDVFANGMEISCKAGDGKSIAAFPDVCMTPPENPATPPGVPVPYPNTGMSSDTTSGTTTIKISGQEVMLKDKSYFKQSTGDEAGAAAKKGVATSVNRGKVYFTAWSMDVKFEGENVVRHMDMTTHNHGSTPNTGPWLYGDSTAFASSGACDKKPDKMASSIKKNCKAPKGGSYADDYSPECCESRKCMMVPFLPNKCCDDEDGTQLTPHHPIPFQDHYPSGSRRLKPDQRKPLPGAGTYDGDKAPCICVEGGTHGYGENGDLMEHGQIGRAFAHYRDNHILKDGRKTYKYKDVNKKAAEIVEGVTGCDAACIQAQMDEYHIKRVKATGDLRKSQQAREGGDEHYS